MAEKKNSVDAREREHDGGQSSSRESDGRVRIFGNQEEVFQTDDIERERRRGVREYLHERQKSNIPFKAIRPYRRR
jgi:hypothetical protein